MGKAADQRRNKRMKYLAKVAKENPESFENEWEKRLSSWIELIQRDAGRLKYKKGKSIPPVFDRVDEAMFILRTCGDGIFRKYAKKTYDLLTNECCRQFSCQVDKRLFRLNNYKKMI